MASFDRRWIEKWQSAVNGDRVARLIGKHFTIDMLLEFGEKPYVVHVRDGEITKIEDQLGSETCYELALRAPDETWSKFVQKVPPPFYNDIIAMSHGRLKIEGSRKVMWQNLRALAWDLDIMREVSN